MRIAESGPAKCMKTCAQKPIDQPMKRTVALSDRMIAVRPLEMLSMMWFTM